MKDENGAAGGSGPQYHVPNLDRALTIAELLATESGGLGLSEISERLELPKNSVFRIAKTLERRGYLERHAGTKKFRLTRKFLGLGSGALGVESLVEKALEEMRELRDETGETVLVGSLLGAEGVVLEQVPGTHNFKFMVDPGTRFFLHTAAPGKAILAALPEAEGVRVLGRMKLVRFNERTITTRKAFAGELERVRACGYGVDAAEELEGQHCVAAAVFNGYGYPVAAVWITAPSARLPQSAFPEAGARVVAAAARISRKLGYELPNVA